MFKKRSKKGLSQVDWAMSLAIFLLYLAWFFIFVKPVFGPSQNMDILLNILQDGFENNVMQDISRVKILVPGSFDSDYEPIIIPFDYAWSASDIAHTADYFVIDNGKMFFLANLSNATKFSMYYPQKASTSTLPSIIQADEEHVTYDSFSGYFTSYLIDHLFFDGETRLQGFKVTFDDNELATSGNFTKNIFLAKYARRGDYANFTTYAFARNSALYSYIASADHRNHSVKIEFATYNYTNFYADQTHNGEIIYSISPKCKYYTTDFLDLYSASSGLLITFGRNISMRLCANETTPTVLLEFDLSAGTVEDFNILLHKGDINSVRDYPVKPIVGVTEKLHTVSVKQVSLLKNRNYDYLKQVFGYPKDRQFNITVTSDVVTASYGIPQPDVADVYARKVEGIIINDRFEAKRAMLTLTVW